MNGSVRTGVGAKEKMLLGGRGWGAGKARGQKCYYVSDVLFE